MSVCLLNTCFSLCFVTVNVTSSDTVTMEDAFRIQIDLIPFIDDNSITLNQVLIFHLKYWNYVVFSFPFFWTDKNDAIHFRGIRLTEMFCFKDPLLNYAHIKIIWILFLQKNINYHMQILKITHNPSPSLKIPVYRNMQIFFLICHV